MELNKIESSRENNLYTLNRFVYNLWNYEPGIINIIKFFLHPRYNEYKFNVGEIAKQIYYEMSYHSHLTSELLSGIHSNMYCECYFNRKHQTPSKLKKHKCVKLLRIEQLDYNEDTFEKKYVCLYGFDFNYLTTVNENEIIKLNEV